MMPLFLKLTALDGTIHHINFYWVETISPITDAADKPVTQLLMVYEDEPIIVKEAAGDILHMIDVEMAKQKERVDTIRAKLINERK